ncbi:MAG TPA: sigma-54 dependent transcriptional regulator [Blastocatellia bacterium]|nr:sigma-54 dependent transcriptional regulator [Blastocatellia bacterium]
MASTRILIVEDEKGIRFAVRSFLEAKGYEVEEADDCRSAEQLFLQSPPDAVISDYVLADGNALELLPRLKAIDSAVPIIILTGHASIDLAVRAIKEGAEHFLTKPVELPSLAVVIERVVENTRNIQKQLARKTLQRREDVDPFLGPSARIRELADEARKVLLSESTVLIRGETGTGKGVLARWLHNNGPRAEEPFVDINCAGLSRELLAAELFGHEKGAFTSAVASKPGLLEIAHRGTVFLDEIGDMDVQVQPNLLKVLEEKRFRRLGSVRDRNVDIRLIAATHQDLGALVRDKRFRSDLFYRISTIPLVVPPLRERIEDIPLLAGHLLNRLAGDLGRPHMELSPECERAMQAYTWPGNIRELRNVLEHAVLLSDQRVIDVRHLRFHTSSEGDDWLGDSRFTLDELERHYIDRVLKEEQGKVEQAARRLGIPRSSLYQRIKKYGITLSRI